MGPDPKFTRPDRIAKLDLDTHSLCALSADSEHERRVAIFDLLEENTFCPKGAPSGPYAVLLSIVERKLVFDISMLDGVPVRRLILSLTPFRPLVRDYFLICESYYDAIRTAAPTQIEAIDMGRRGIHNEGSQLLQERLKGKVEMDFDTARRLFTLISALHVRG